MVDPQELPKYLEMAKDPDPATRKDAIHNLADINHPDAVSALGELLKDSDPVNKVYALAALGNNENPQKTDALIQALRNPKIEFRRNIPEKLARIGGKKAFAALYKATKDEDPAMRRHVVGALGKVDRKRATYILFNALRDLDLEVRVTAVKSLGYKRGPEVVSTLVGAMDDFEECVGKEAAKALGQIGDHAAIESLVAQLENGGNHDVRKEAGEALWRICRFEGLLAKAHLFRSQEDRIIALLKGKDASKQTTAILAAGMIRISRAVPSLMDLLGDRPLADLAIPALGAISGLRDAQGLYNGSHGRLPHVKDRIANCYKKRIRLMLKSRKWKEREGAAKACAEIGLKGAERELIELLDDNNLKVRKAAMKALGKYKSKKAIPALKKRIIAKHSGLPSEIKERILAIELLGEIGRVKAMPFFISMYYREDNPEIRQRLEREIRVAMNNLIHVADDAMVPLVLIGFIQDSDIVSQSIRENAMRTYPELFMAPDEIPPKRIRKFMLKTFREYDCFEIRSAVLCLLADIGEQDTLGTFNFLKKKLFSKLVGVVDGIIEDERSCADTVALCVYAHARAHGEKPDAKELQDVVKMNLRRIISELRIARSGEMTRKQRNQNTEAVLQNVAGRIRLSQIESRARIRRARRFVPDGRTFEYAARCA